MAYSLNQLTYVSSLAIFKASFLILNKIVWKYVNCRAIKHPAIIKQPLCMYYITTLNKQCNINYYACNIILYLYVEGYGWYCFTAAHTKYCVNTLYSLSSRHQLQILYMQSTWTKYTNILVTCILVFKILPKLSTWLAGNWDNLFRLTHNPSKLHNQRVVDILDSVCANVIIF